MNKTIVIYVNNESPQVFTVGLEYRYKKGTLVKEININNNDVIIIFEDREVIIYHNVSYECHTKLNKNGGIE